MRCYYQGELQVTGGTVDEIENLAKIKLEHAAFAYMDNRNETAVNVEFGDSMVVREGDVLAFISAAEERGWVVNGEVPYYGDYEGKLFVTDNSTKEFSIEELAVKEYQESPAVQKEKEISEQAVSMAAYLFLRLVFGKENYQETVTENLEWLAEELTEDNPADILVRNLKKELQEGNYGSNKDIVPQQLQIYFGFDKADCEKVISLLFA